MANFIFWGILLVVLGLLAVPSLLLSKKPNAKELFEKIAPYQGWIGVVLAFVGLWWIIDALLSLSLLSVLPMFWITYFLDGIIMVILGFMLGYNIVSKHMLSKNEKAAEKGAEMLKKLMPLQGTLGIIAIILGVWTIIYYFILRAQIVGGLGL